jgi:Flp pilus assembly pilin Flp
MVEYVLVLLLIALVVILAIPAVANGISAAFAKIAAAFGA